jgi:hypothetical protein
MTINKVNLSIKAHFYFCFAYCFNTKNIKTYKNIAVLVLDDFRLGPKVQERRSVCLEGNPVYHGQRDPRRHRLQPTTQSGHGNRFVNISKNKQCFSLIIFTISEITITQSV